LLLKYNNKIHTSFYKDIINTAQNDEFGITVCFDGWKNVKKQEIMDSVLITFDGQVLV
jgi:hypothetical protein